MNKHWKIWKIKLRIHNHGTLKWFYKYHLQHEIRLGNIDIQMHEELTNSVNKQCSNWRGSKGTELPSTTKNQNERSFTKKFSIIRYLLYRWERYILFLNWDLPLDFFQFELCQQVMPHYAYTRVNGSKLIIFQNKTWASVSNYNG